LPCRLSALRLFRLGSGLFISSLLQHRVHGSVLSCVLSDRLSIPWTVIFREADAAARASRASADGEGPAPTEINEALREPFVVPPGLPEDTATAVSSPSGWEQSPE